MAERKPEFFGSLLAKKYPIFPCEDENPAKILGCQTLGLLTTHRLFHFFLLQHISDNLYISRHNGQDVIAEANLHGTRLYPIK